MHSKSVCAGIVVGAFAVGGLLMLGAGDPPPSAKTSEPASADTGPGIPAEIADAAFLAGRWQGVMGKNKDSFVEEVWTEPGGKNAIGMFRWNKPDGTSTVQELLTITEEGGTLLLRLRHQSAAGVAWEEKDKPLTFALAEKSPTLLRFDSLRDTGDVSRCRYEINDGRLRIDVEFASPSAEMQEAGKKQRPPLHFDLTRKPF